MAPLLALLDVVTLLFLAACFPTCTGRNARKALTLFASIIFLNLAGWIVQ